MQQLHDIEQALVDLQQQVTTAIGLIGLNNTINHSSEIMIKLRQAQDSIRRSRSRIGALLDSQKSSGSSSTHRGMPCPRCREILPREQIEQHILQKHGQGRGSSVKAKWFIAYEKMLQEEEDRKRAMARVAAELQQRDEDLYHDD